MWGKSVRALLRTAVGWPPPGIALKGRAPATVFDALVIIVCCNSTPRRLDLNGFVSTSNSECVILVDRWCKLEIPTAVIAADPHRAIALPIFLSLLNKKIYNINIMLGSVVDLPLRPPHKPAHQKRYLRFPQWAVLSRRNEILCSHVVRDAPSCTCDGAVSGWTT